MPTRGEFIVNKATRDMIKYGIIMAVLAFLAGGFLIFLGSLMGAGWFGITLVTIFVIMAQIW